MANYVLPIVARNRRGFPAWVDVQSALGNTPTIPDDASVSPSKNGLIIVCGDTGNTVLPIASNVLNDKAEVLLRFERHVTGSQSFGNIGGSILFKPSKDVDLTASYQFCISSGSSLTYNLYKYSSANGFTALGGSIGLGSVWLNKSILLRARKDTSSLKFRAWYKGDPEPSSWGIDVTDATYNVDSIVFQIGSYNQLISIKELAYATNGDTASFDLPPVVDIMAGTVPNAKDGDIVNIHDLATHNIVDSIVLPSSGAWTSNLYNNRPVYARIERASGSEYDFLFAKYGGTYLGGDYPDGSLKDDGAPSEGEVSVLYRSGDPILGGATIAKVSAPQSGEWRVSGLQPNVPFDVVARKSGRKDVVVSEVVGFPDPEFKFTLMGGVSYSNNYIRGFLLAKGAAVPLTAVFTGTTPYGLDNSKISINGNSLTINTPMRDYGSFDFGLSITDSSSKNKIQPISLVDAERSPFVELVEVLLTTDRASGTTPINATIPTSARVGDILVVSIMRRGSVTVSDNNSGVWVLGADTFYSAATLPQGNSIYHRAVKEGDVGKVITVNAPYSGRLVVYLNIYRGLFAPLKVIGNHISPSRFDSTYGQAVKNLQPITHTSGFLVRAVSIVYAATTGTSYAAITNMVNTGPTERAVSNGQIRLQVAHKHLPAPSTLSGVTYDTGIAGEADEVVSDISIILDEIRT